MSSGDPFGAVDRLHFDGLHGNGRQDVARVLWARDMNWSAHA